METESRYVDFLDWQFFLMRYYITTTFLGIRFRFCYARDDINLARAGFFGRGTVYWSGDPTTGLPTKAFNFQAYPNEQVLVATDEDFRNEGPLYDREICRMYRDDSKRVKSD